jgi:hypothetical protein|tara:strand:- start:10131 stop:11816 length:1686 start_codon:yes stop_codon:yes gene_type:complete
MNNFVKKIIAYIKYYNHNKKKFNYLRSSDSKTLVMVEFFQYFPSMLAFSHYIEVITKNFSTKPILYSPTLPMTFFKRCIFFLKCLINPYFHLYKSMGIKNIIISKKRKKFTKKANEFYKKKLLHVTKSDIESLKVKNIYIGDLLYDEYLKFYNKPTLDLNDPVFVNFVKEFLSAFYYWEDFFNKKSKSINSMIVSHTVYLMGLMCRIAATKDIAVFAIGIAQSTRVDKKNIFKFDDTKYFKQTFSKLNSRQKKESLKIGRLSLLNRMRGEMDQKMLLDEQTDTKVFGSDKRRTKLFKNTGKVRVLVATHCFTDSVHYYGKPLFPDFFEWLVDIGKLSETHDYDFYIKFHPAEYDANKQHFEYFKKYKKLKLLPKKTNNNIIFKEKVDAVITIYGSVGHEYPLFNIPVINATTIGPHTSYSFNHYPKNINEYHKLIKNIKKLKVNREKVKNEIYQYNYLRYESNFSLIPNYVEIIRKLGVKNHGTSLIFREYLDSYYSAEYSDHLNKNILSFIKSKELKFYYFDSINKSFAENKGWKFYTTTDNSQHHTKNLESKKHPKLKK